MNSHRHRLFVAERLRQALDPIELVYHHSCGSTNRECMLLAQDNMVVISDHQSEGRGRRGKQWYSPHGKNLYCSLGLEKQLPAEWLGLISLQVGVAIASLLRSYGYQAVSLKWPNDVLMAGSKLGGILIETRALANDHFFLAVGIGLNLQLDPAEVEAIDQPAIALSQVKEVQLDHHDLVTELVQSVQAAIRQFQPSHRHQLLQHFAGYDALAGKPVRVKSADAEFNGVYAGIEDDGQVRIQDGTGLRRFAAAEISLRESDHAAD